MLSLPLIFWSTLATLITIATFYVLINYEVQRWKDKQRLREGIYIRRVTRFEALITILTPVFPGLAYVTEIYDTGPVNVWVEIAALLLSVLMVGCLRYVHVAYVKTSADGIEQRIWFSNPTRYPFNAINRVVFYKAAKYEDDDMVGFYAKSGTQIALFCPTIHNNYRLMAIVRFRIEQERWPDMNNSGDVAKVNELDDRGMTILYFRGREKVTGLADVDM